MYYLIDSIEQLKVLENSGHKEAFIHIIPFNNHTHPSQDRVSLVYLRPLTAEKGYIICVSHSEGLMLDYNVVYKTLSKFKRLYTINKKISIQLFPLSSLIDINLPPHMYIQEDILIYDFYYHKFKDFSGINRVIPIVKHYEIYEKMFRDNVEKCVPPLTKYSKFFNSKTTLVFASIESKGIKINQPLFEDYFHSTTKNVINTQYNLKTLTGRPSNTFNGVNYLALNKKNGCRKSFIPKNDIFVEIDITAYHPTLAALLVKHKFPTSNIHQYFADLYKVDYDKSKFLTFQQLYGGVFDKYKHIEFFQKVEKFIKGVWKKFEEEGQYECLVSGYIFYKDKMEDMNPQKLFNYILQNLETSINILLMKSMIYLLKDKNTKLVHYCYDSFLFDFDYKEKDLNLEIKKIFKKYKLNYKGKQGINYDFTRT